MKGSEDNNIQARACARSKAAKIKTSLLSSRKALDKVQPTLGHVVARGMNHLHSLKRPINDIVIVRVFAQSLHLRLHLLNLVQYLEVVLLGIVEGAQGSRSAGIVLEKDGEFVELINGQIGDIARSSGDVEDEPELDVLEVVTSTVE